MCFSASASFGAGVVLTTIGILSIRKAKTSSQKMFAFIPLIFAVQQISEGFVWLSLSDPYFAPLRNVMTYIFLFFAQVVWPFWVPFSIFKLEKKEKRRKILKVLAGIGALLSLCLAYCLVTYHMEAKILGHHIAYQQDFPKILKYGAFLYVIATIAPSFFSSVKRMWILSIAILVSYVVTAIFYREYLLSVWCFFASVISIVVFVVIAGLQKRE